MNTLTKDELATQLAAKMGIPSVQAHQAVSNTLELIQQGVAQGRKVELRGFASFIPKVRAERVGRNPRDPNHTPITIPAKNTVRFKLSPTFKKALNTIPGTPAA